MSFSLYDATVNTYQQILGSTLNFLNKGKSHFEESGDGLTEILNEQLIEDMLPFRFQVLSVAHHSLGALKGVQIGEFGPPTPTELDYSGLVNLVENSLAGVEGFSKEDVNAWIGKSVVFRMDGMEIPFTAEGFLLSFSLPNFYFHATTTYDILRMKGVQIGKRDFLGQLRLNR
ncbi:MAG: DUF1993 domain-containing protein [Gammaproteobacteria bacterium]|nr:DUF1993 domain-containing protein [Gammaproteobacteria bacterium]